MIFMHIVDDYYLQGILASMKQKEWWKKNAPDKCYRFDYAVALFTHAFSWSFMIMIIPTIYYIMNTSNWREWFIIPIFSLNMGIHAVIDNEKANNKSINLVIDQLIHILQIVGTWYALVMINY